MRLFNFLCLLIPFVGFAQEPSETNALEVSYFYGNIYKHSKDIGHLITGHPDGVLISLNRQTFGDKEWQQAYNYPDYGVYFQYQDLKNEYLGKNFAIGMHYNFYFFKRHLVFRISQGLGATTNPYDKETNYKNNAFGSKLLSSNLFSLNYKKENIIDRFGIQAGFMLTHFSNGRIKSPNSGINTFAMAMGINYNLNEKQEYIRNDSLLKMNFSEPIRYNMVFRTGVNESQIVGSGQKPFYHFGLYADKRIGRKSALQLGTDVFVSQYLKEFIKYSSVAYPNRPYLDPNTDYKRVGIFLGHELFVNRLSVETQLGYYVYKPFKYDIDIYQRLGAKYYLNDKLFTGIGLKAHGGRAEAIEITFGVRL